MPNRFTYRGNYTTGEILVNKRACKSEEAPLQAAGLLPGKKPTLGAAAPNPPLAIPSHRIALDVSWLFLHEPPDGLAANWVGLVVAQHQRQVDVPPLRLVRAHVIVAAARPGPRVAVYVGGQPGDGDASVNGR